MKAQAGKSLPLSLSQYVKQEAYAGRKKEAAGRSIQRVLSPALRTVQGRRMTVSKEGSTGKDSQRGMESKSEAGECAFNENEGEKYAAYQGQQPGNLPKEQGRRSGRKWTSAWESTIEKLSAKKGHFAVYLFLVVASEGTLQSPPSQPTAYLHMAKSVSPCARPRGGGGQILERPAHLKSLAYSLSPTGRVG